MSDNFLNKMGNLFISSLLGGLMISVVFGIALLFLTTFCQMPTGKYYVKAQSGFTSAVKEDVRFGTDRLVFFGPNGAAWNVYGFLKNGPPSIKPDPNRTALRML